jgi:hypothetical protein
MLPLSMFFHPEPRRASQSGKSFFPPPVFPFLCSLSPLRCRCGASAPRLFPRFCSGGSSDPCFSSSLHPTPHIPNPFTIRTSAKSTCNPCRIRSFKTLDLKSFRMCSSEKKGWGRGMSQAQGRQVAAVVVGLFTGHRPRNTGHGSRPICSAHPMR